MKRKKEPSRAPLVSISTTQPLELVCIDFFTLEQAKGGHQRILVVTDHFTKYAQAYLTRNQTAKNCRCAVSSIYCALWHSKTNTFGPRVKFWRTFDTGTLEAIGNKTIKNITISSNGRWISRGILPHTVFYIGTTTETKLEITCRTSCSCLYLHKAYTKKPIAIFPNVWQITTKETAKLICTRIKRKVSQSIWNSNCTPALLSFSWVFSCYFICFD